MRQSPRISPTQPSVLITRLGVRALVHRFRSGFKPLLLTALLTANVASGAVAAGSSAVTSGLSANVNATGLVTDYKAAKALAEFDALTTAETKVSKVDDVTLACPEGCFVAGTTVLTNEGLKPIDTFVGGELVWSHNEETGEGNFKRVQSTKATAHQLIYRITLSNSSRQSEVIESTSEHPFWVDAMGWVKAADLTTDMSLLDRDKQPISVQSVENTGRYESVFNIQVEHSHNYFVGDLGVWVHNAECCDVDSYKNLKYTEIVGDGLEHDHIPSFAAVRKAKELELGHPLTDAEARQLYNQSIAVEVPKEVHVQSPTYGGRNTGEQVLKDAIDLCGAVCRDTTALRINLLNKGISQDLVDKAIQQIIDQNKALGVIK